jgi:3,4-dihydroxy-9,10-secoandrosta-1,3,5(10)-triene-9,17-dione 4,5-dioxygenase
MGIENLGYVRMQMTDPQAWADFAVDILGFGVAEHDDGNGSKYLRMDDAPFRYIVEQGDEDKFVASGLQLSSAEAYAALVEKLQAAGVQVETGSDDEANRRAVTAFSSCYDPSGNLAEFYHGRHDGMPFTPNHNIKAFITGEMGLGHLVIPAPENEATEAFYTSLFDFGISDDLTLPPPAEGAPNQRVLFMHADNPRHHTLGLYNFPSPTGLIHLMIEVGSIDEVGYCMDRVKKAGLHIFSDLGRHSNDEMVSFYFFAPGGMGLEYGFDGKQVADWSQYTPTKTTSGDYWGHEYDFPQIGE